jgi:hypothetical protein
MDEIQSSLRDTACIDGITEELLTHDESRRKRPQTWACLNESIIRICWDILFKNSMAHGCRTIKSNYLFKPAFQIFTQNGKELHMTPEFGDYFERYYKQFGKDFLDALMVIGVVPYDLVQQENGHFYPRIPAPNTYIIQMTYATESEKRYYRVWRPKKYSVQYSNQKNHGYGFASGMSVPHMVGGRAFSGLGGSFTDAMHGQLSGNSFAAAADQWYWDRDMYVIDGLGFDPGVDGTINSPLSAIIPDMVFMNSLSDKMQQAEEQMINPLILMQYHKNVDAETAIDPKVAHNLPVFDSDEFALQTKKNTEMVQEQVVALQQQFAVLRRIEKKMGSAEYDAGDRDPRELMEVSPRVISLPRGLEFVRGDGLERHVGNKFLHQQDVTHDAIARQFGIPLTMLKNIGVLRGFQEAHRENFRNQLGEDATLLGNYMTFIFNEIYGQNTYLMDTGLLRRKEVVDDTNFTDLPRGHGKLQDVKIDVESTAPLAPVDAESTKEMFKEKGAAPQPDEAIVTDKDKREAVRELKRKNVEFRKGAIEEGPEGSTRMRNKSKSKFSSYVITIPVAIHAEAKVAKHAWDVGAIDLETYQTILRSKVGLGRMPFKKNPKFIEDIINTTIRASGSEPPRVDSQKPEGEDLGVTAKKFEQEKKPAPGMMAEAVKKKKLTVREVKEVERPKGLDPNSGEKSKSQTGPGKRKSAASKQKEPAAKKKKADRS